MGFIRDFGSKPSTTGQSPRQPKEAPLPHSQAPKDPNRPRGFFADFYTGPTHPEPPANQDPAPQIEPPATQPERPRTWLESRAAEEATSPAPAQTSYTAPIPTLWEPPSSKPAANSYEVERLTSDLRSLTEKLQSLSRGDSESRISELEQDIYRTKQALSQSKETALHKRQQTQFLEKRLERSKRIVSNMEMRMAGFKTGWDRGGGGGRWRHRHNDEFLFTREELRGPENADERENQMGLVLDSRRDKVWKLTDELSNSRSAQNQAETKTKELEYKLDRLQDQLYQARQAKQNRNEQRSNLEGRLTDLKMRYRQLTGRSYGS